jgi:acetyl esterase/lipase
MKSPPWPYGMRWNGRRRLVGGPIHERSEGSIAASPVTCVFRSAPSFHIQHGARDRLVLVGQSQALHQALLAAGAASTLVALEGTESLLLGRR